MPRALHLVSVNLGAAAPLPAGERVVMSGIGHLMNLESPDEFDQLLIHFLRETQALVRH